MGWGEGPERGPGLAVQGCWDSRHSLPFPTKSHTHGKTGGSKARLAQVCRLLTIRHWASFFLSLIAPCGTSLSLAPKVGPGGRGDALGEHSG